MTKYFYTDGVTKFGPFSKEELMAQKISRNTKVWYFGLENWTELSQVSELSDIFSVIPPEFNPRSYPPENIIEGGEDESIKKNNLPPLKTKKTKIYKWFIFSAIIFVLFLLIIRIVHHQSQAKLYKQIVENSYDGDENFDIYIEKFYRDLEYYGIFPKKPKTTIIKFSKLDQLDNTTHIHGVSFGHNDDNRIEIYINPSSWEKFKKPMRHFLIYHELAHDVLNLDDLALNPSNEGKLMYPEFSRFENINMDDFIESFHNLFEEESSKWKYKLR